MVWPHIPQNTKDDSSILKNSLKDSFQRIAGITGIVLKDTGELQTVLFTDNFSLISVNNII